MTEQEYQDEQNENEAWFGAWNKALADYCQKAIVYLNIKYGKRQMFVLKEFGIVSISMN